MSWFKNARNSIIVSRAEQTNAKNLANAIVVSLGNWLTYATACSNDLLSRCWNKCGSSLYCLSKYFAYLEYCLLNIVPGDLLISSAYLKKMNKSKNTPIKGSKSPFIIAIALNLFFNFSTSISLGWCKKLGFPNNPKTQAVMFHSKDKPRIDMFPILIEGSIWLNSAIMKFSLRIMD
eukprot:NODE_800_length_4111_cov_0.200598.p2 type:complete len:177 gc:universal NODE_800_length_4111_cov_0.200598:3025-3555(+)